MPTLEARGVELAWAERGTGDPVLLVHETATDALSWEGVAAALDRGAGGARAISYDRRGWGASTAPDGYVRTTVEEQSEDAAVLVESLRAGPVVLCGAGLGALISLDLLLRRPEIVRGAVLVEPPLLALLPEATELLSADLSALEAVAGEGREALVELFLSGGLGALAAGVERLPAELTAPARERPASLVAELGAAAAWSMPISRLATAERPVLIVSGPSSPTLLRAAAQALPGRLTGSELREVGPTPLPPHLGAADRIAALALELSEPGAR
jgi:pimeloyl-ACP methyl ester carboxylesterase